MQTQKGKKNASMNLEENLVDDDKHKRWHNPTPIKDIVNGTYGSDPFVTGVYWLENTVERRGGVFVVRFVLIWWTKFISYYKESQKQPGIKESSIREKFQPSRCRQDRKDQNSPVLWLNFSSEVLSEYDLSAPINFNYESIKTYLPWWTEYGEKPSETFLKHPKNNGSRKGKKLKKNSLEKRKRESREDIMEISRKRQKQDTPPSQINHVTNIPFNIPPPTPVPYNSQRLWYRPPPPSINLHTTTVSDSKKLENLGQVFWWDPSQDDPSSSESTEDSESYFSDFWAEVIQFWKLYRPPFVDTKQ